MAMSRFLYSSSSLKSFETCPAQFHLNQTGAERGPSSDILNFGTAFHLVMQFYVDHCISENRHSDLAMIPEFIERAIRRTGLSLRHFDELTMLLKQFLTVYKIDFEHSVAREGGIAFDSELRGVPWSDSLEYENMTAPALQKGMAFFRSKLDHTLLFPDSKTLKIEDYKTDRFAPSKTAIMDPSSRFYQQARTYAWAAHRGIFPAEVVEVEFVFARYCAYGKPLTRTLVFNTTEIDETQDLLLAKAKFIENTEEFRAKPGDHCNLCSFRETACPVRSQISLQDPGDRMRKYLFLKVETENLREQLKDDVAEYGYSGELGPLRAEFAQTEELVPDMERLVAALQAEGISKWWAITSLSKTAAKSILDKDQYTRVINAAYDPEIAVKFNVHQRKDRLIELAEARGIDPTKKTVHELAMELAGVAEAPIEVDLESILQETL